MAVQPMTDSRWCWRHIPHNLIAGGGLDSYGGTYGGHPDLGGSAGAHHGEIVPEPAEASLSKTEAPNG